MNKQGITQIFKSIRRSFKKHSPEILTGIGIAGMVTATVLAVKATPKAMKLLESKKQAQKTEKLTVAETVKTAWVCYIPTAITLTISVSCIIGAATVHSRRGAALAAAYTLSETARKEYGDKVIELFGQNKDREVKDAVAKDKIDNHPVRSSEIIITGHGDTLCYDVLSGRYFKSDIEKLKRIENELNHAMINGGEMYISLNDFYYAVGLSNIQIGDDLGWNVSSDLMCLDFSSQLTGDGVPCLVVGYRTPPHYDYSIS